MQMSNAVPAGLHKRKAGKLGFFGLRVVSLFEEYHGVRGYELMFDEAVHHVLDCEIIRWVDVDQIVGTHEFIESFFHGHGQNLTLGLHLQHFHIFPDALGSLLVLLDKRDPHSAPAQCLETHSAAARK